MGLLEMMKETVALSSSMVSVGMADARESVIERGDLLERCDSLNLESRIAVEGGDRKHREALAV